MDSQSIFEDDFNKKKFFLIRLIGLEIFISWFFVANLDDFLMNF